MKFKFNVLGISILTIVLLFNFSSCKKDDEPTLSKKDLLTAHVWKYSSIELPSSLDPLVKALYVTLISGSTYSFSTDGHYTITESQGTDTGTWEFNSDLTKIITDKGTTDESTIEIVTLTTTNLDLKENDADLGGEYTLKLVK